MRHEWKQFKFSKREIDKLQPSAKRTYYRDSDAPGLALLVTPSGAKSFYFIRWCSGKTCFIRLQNGTYPAMTPDQARKVVSQLNGEVAQGKDPAEARRALRGELTLGDLFSEWIEHKQQHGKRSWEQDQATFRRYLEPWKSWRLSSVTHRRIMDWHTKAGSDHGPYAANAGLRLMRAMFNWGIARHGLDLDNPVMGIKPFPEVKRESWIDADAMPRLLTAIEADSNPDMRDFFLLCLLTGARRGNVQAMRWDAVSLSGATWTIPSSEHKTRRPQCIPLSTPALTILQARYALYGRCPWVFPSSSASGHLEEPKAAWKRIIDRAGLSGIRIHDLRHTAASWMVNRGIPLAVIGKALGHTQPATTGRYAHLANDPVREALELSGAAMLATRKPDSVVIPLNSTRPRAGS